MTKNLVVVGNGMAPGRVLETLLEDGGGDHLQVVSGTGGDLGWWLTGRGQGGGLAADPGGLPRIGPWRRTPAK